MIVNFLFFFLGYIISGLKVFYQFSRWNGWSKDLWGLRAKEISYVLKNLEREPERFAHHLTDYVVEWTRLNPQRAAKTFAGIWLLTTLMLLIK